MARGVVFSDAILDEIKSRTNFADLASEHVKLKRSGKTLSGLCPFHSEKTPSFHINDEEGFFNCFGCGKKGSLFNFVMETRGLTFPEAVKFLAGRAGVELTLEGDEGGRNVARERTALLREILRAAAVAYGKEYDRSKVVSSYVHSRGITQETIERFGLGYAPRSWAFIVEAVKRELAYSSKAIDDNTLRSLLLEVGLIRRRSDTSENSAEKEVVGAQHSRGESSSALETTENTDKPVRDRGAYDLLRDRLIFPISRSDGTVVAFGGRLMSADSKAPKYLNTPESPLYLKRRTLFGLAQAMDTLRRTKHGFLVEGYLDVMAMSQAGFQASVACCGTAITVEHAQVLSRLAERVTVIFDGDSAGRKAASKSVESFLNCGVDLLVAMLPDGEDPDSLIKKGGTEELRQLIDKSLSGIDYLVSAAIREETSGGGGITPSASGRIAQELSRVVAKVKNPVEREFCLKVVADKLGVSIDSFDKLVREEVRREGRNGSFGGSDNSRPVSPAFGTTPRPTPRINSSESRQLTRNGQFRQNSDIPDGFDPWAGVPPIDESGFSPGGWPDPSIGTAGSHRPAPEFKSAKSSYRNHLGPLADEQKLISQLMVTVLCEPSVAEEVLQLSSLFPGSDGQEGEIPQSFVEFLNAVKREEIPRAELFLDDDERGQNERERVVLLLNSMGFGGEALVSEAVRQLSIGGIKPSQLVRDFAKASLSQDIRLEVRSINDRLSGDNVDDVDKLKLAQDKLLKRRSLEQLR